MRILGLLLAIGVGLAEPGLTRPQWFDPAGRRPTTFREWTAHHAAADAASHTGKVLETGRLNVVEVVVEAGIFPGLAAELALYAADLQAAGYSVRMDSLRGNSHQVLRQLLQGISELKGVVLVGDLPVAWYESDWGGSAPEEFPCDLYFADLNGTWVDSDGDGLFDDHTGNTAPEIWVGRLNARPLTWDDETRLIRRYFEKNHLYRTGGLTLPDQGLCFNDDDWAGSGNCGLNVLYPSVTVIEDYDQTTAPNYRAQLLVGYEWIHVMSHSSCWGHTFNSSSGYTGTVFNCEIYALQPHANFYDLFSCSGTRFVEENYSAGWDVFNEDWGLLAVGSTKTGSMMGWFEDFYSPMASGQCIGDAFKSWFTAHGEASRDWHYGLAIIGDPTLKPRHRAARGSPPSARSPEFSAPGSRPPAIGRGPLSDIVGAHPETDAEPAIAAARDGKVWVVWVTGRTPANGRFDIHSAYRSPSGWSSAMPVGNFYYWEYNPALAIDSSGQPLCIWSKFEDSYHYNLYYSRWNGASWSSPLLVSEDPSEDMKPALTLDGSGRLWCFWQSRRDYSQDIFACYWNGTGWSSPQNVTRDSTDEYYPTAVTDSAGRPWVFFTRHDQGISRIHGCYWSGANWVASGPVSATQTRAYRPAGCRDGTGRLWVTWQNFDGFAADIYASSFDGINWSEPARVSTSRALDVMPAMTCDAEGKPWVAWQSKQMPAWSIYVSYFTGAWTDPILVDSGSGFNLNPRIVGTTDGGLWVTWQNYETGGNWEIKARNLPLTSVSAPNLNPPAREPTLSCRPNPAHRQVTIRYALDYRETGRLGLYDQTGSCIVDLGRVAGAGTASVSEELPPGIYFVRLATRRGTASIKLVSRPARAISKRN
jgi:hypothetical protein